MTTNKNYLIELDGLRCIAVTLVMLDHWLGEVVQLPLGYFGVNLFFVLSGFLITRILLVSKARDKQLNRSHGQSIRTFIIRRSLRIFPVYYLTIFVLAAINFPAVRDTLPWLLTYTQNIWIVLHQTWLGAIDHLWSLAVEEQYYLFFPFLILFIPDRWVRPMLWGLVALAVSVRILLFATNAPWMAQFVLMPTCLDAFGAGGLLAFALLAQPDRFAQLMRQNGWLLAALGLYALNLYAMKTLTPARNLATDVTDRFVTSVLCMLLIGRAVVGFGGWTSQLLRARAVVYLGQISYGLYLFHNLIFNYYHSTADYPTLRLWNRLLRELPALADAPTLSLLLRICYFYILTVGLATVSWHLLEKPINKLKDKVAY